MCFTLLGVALIIYIIEMVFRWIDPMQGPKPDSYWKNDKRDP